jgi:hypothetical protein
MDGVDNGGVAGGDGARRSLRGRAAGVLRKGAVAVVRRPWPRWMRRPIVPAAALLLGAAVSLVQGQPSPVDPPVGVSIPADDAPPPATVGQLMVVYDGAVFRVNPVNRRALQVDMPAGARALKMLPAYRAHVVQVRMRSGRLVAYALPDTGGLVRLGDASSVAPDVGNRTVWLSGQGRARQVRLDGSQVGAPIAIPIGYHAVSGLRGELVVAGTGPNARTLLLPDKRKRVLAEGEALDVAGSTVLLRRRNQLLTFDVHTRVVTLLPQLSAVTITGPGTLMENGAAFAVVGTVGEHQRLEVGPIAPRSGSELQLVGLDGGLPLPYPPAARWTGYGSVLAVRPDGRVVFYQPGQRRATVLDLGLPAVVAVASG